MNPPKDRAVLALDLSNEQDYNIASALRGPDSDKVSLKMMTTCVIRYLVGIRTNVGVAVMSPDEVKETWSYMGEGYKAEVRKLWHAHEHFQWHVTAAFAALQHHRGIAEAGTYWAWWKEQMAVVTPDDTNDIPF